MQLKKYIIDSKMFEYDRHYRDCAQRNIPFIKAKINPAHGNYHVQIDMMPCDYKFSKSGLSKLRVLFEKELKFTKLTDIQNKLDPYSISNELSWVDGISQSRVNPFCELLYDFSLQHRE